MKLAIVIVTTVVAVMIACVSAVLFFTGVVGIPSEGYGLIVYFLLGYGLGAAGCFTGFAWYDAWRGY